MFTRRDTAPVFFLWVDGQPADDLRRRLSKANVKISTKKMLEAKLTMQNTDRTLLDDPRTFPNSRWSFRFGFLNNLSPIYTGLIRNVEPSYEENVEVVFTLLDDTSTLATASHGRNWGKVRSSDIARSIAKLHDLDVVADESPELPKKARIQAMNVNDLQFLRDLALQDDFEVYVDGSPPTLYFTKKLYDGPSKGTLVYRDDPSLFARLLSFKPKVKSLGALSTSQSGATTGKGKDSNTSSDKGVSLGSKQGGADSPKEAEGSVVFQLDGNSDVQTYYTEDTKKRKGNTVSTPTGASGSVAQVKHQQMLDRANEADAKCLLSPDIMIRDKITILGVEKQVQGKWYVDEVTHDISATSADTSLSLKRNAKGAGGKDSKNPNNKDGSSSSDGAGGTVSIVGETGDSFYVSGPQSKAQNGGSK